MGIINITWSDRESSGHYVQEPKPLQSKPGYGEVWKFKDFMEYAAYSGYYRFYGDGTVTLDDGVKTRECPSISFQYESTSA